MPSPSPVRVTVCVVAYESGAFLQPCLDALARSGFDGFECVVADNGASDGSVAALRLPDARFRVEAMGGNLGFAAANNCVARASGAELFACLNPDAQPDPGWLGALVEAADARAQAASFGSVQLRLDDPAVLDGLGDCWHLAGVAWRAREGAPATQIPGDGPILAPCGAAALYRRELFVAHGGFEERFFCYAEDVDLGLRLQRAGWRAWRASGSVVRHAGSGVSGRRSAFTIYHGHRNRVWCWVKNTPGPAFWALLPLHLMLDAYLLYAAWRHGVAGAALRAYRDALVGIGPFWRERARATGWERLRPVSTLSLRALGRRELVPDAAPDAALSVAPDILSGVAHARR